MGKTDDLRNSLTEEIPKTCYTCIYDKVYCEYYRRMVSPVKEGEIITQSCPWKWRRPVIEDETALMEPPRCHLHDRFMELRDPKYQTAEQKWCGVWYECKEPGCSCTALIPSKELREEYRKAGRYLA